MLLNIISLVSIPPFQLTKWPQRGWSSIFGVIPWLSPFQIVLTITFWSIRSSFGHVSTENHAQIPLVVADQKWSISKMLRHSLNISFGTEINPNHGISKIQIRTFTPWDSSSIFTYEVHVILVDTWTSSNLIGQNYLGWREPLNYDIRTQFSGHFVSKSGGIRARLELNNPHLGDLLLWNYLSIPYTPRACGRCQVHHVSARCTAVPHVSSLCHPETLASDTARQSVRPCPWGQRSERSYPGPDGVHWERWQWYVSALHVQGYTCTMVGTVAGVLH